MPFKKLLYVFISVAFFSSTANLHAMYQDNQDAMQWSFESSNNDYKQPKSSSDKPKEIKIIKKPLPMSHQIFKPHIVVDSPAPTTSALAEALRNCRLCCYYYYSQQQL